MAPDKQSRQYQERALQAAERQVNKSRTKLAADLGIGYDQYARYVNGDTPLKFEQVALFADAYGLDPQILGQAILTGDVGPIEDTAPAGWDMATALRPHVPQDDIPGFVARHAHKTLAQQQAAVRGIISDVHEAQRKAAQHNNRSA